MMVLTKINARHTIARALPAGNAHVAHKRYIFAAPMEGADFKNINYVNWEESTSEGLVLVDFWAEWCSACVAQDRFYEELARRYGGNIVIGKLHVGDNRVLSDRLGVRNVPYLIIMDDGKELARMPGVQSKEYIVSLIERAIADRDKRTKE